MTEQEKELLFRDLCGRFEHFVQVHIDIDYQIDHEFYSECHTVPCDAYILEVNFDEKTLHIILDDENEDKNNYFQEEFDTDWVDFYEVKPYLRPMESMTEKEKSKLRQWGCLCMNLDDSVQDVGVYGAIHSIPVIDYLNSIHVDYRGLIPMGLALPAKEGMYK